VPDRIDFNCDLGEGCGDDAAILPHVSSASIACGGHAGDDGTMREAVGLCLRHGVAIGAHPSFVDREHFGRRDLDLGAGAIHLLVLAQVRRLAAICDAAGARLCFAVMESYPPQCGGLPVAGWTWDGLEGAETANGVTWGAYAVQGTYDGEALTVTQPPILLALYDPMMRDDPTGGVPGDTAESRLLEIQEELPGRLGADLLGSWPQDGRLWVQVVWDDGTWQDAADADFGDDVVVIESWLREVG